MPKTAILTRLPGCQEGKCRQDARIDCKTFSGPWGYFCLTHWAQVRATDRLGTGIGQYLLLEGETPPDWVGGP